MKKIGLLVREVSQKRITESLKDAESAFVIKYSKLSSADMTALRKSLKECNADLLVVKNSLTRRALAESQLDSITKYIDGPCGIVFTKKEPVDVSKALCNFIKEHEQLKVEGGFLKDKILEYKDVEFLAKLPSKDALKAQLVCTLNSPISGFVNALGQLMQKFVVCLDQIKQKKSS